MRKTNVDRVMENFESLSHFNDGQDASGLCEIVAYASSVESLAGYLKLFDDFKDNHWKHALQVCDLWPVETRVIDYYYGLYERVRSIRYGIDHGYVCDIDWSLNGVNISDVIARAWMLARQTFDTVDNPPF